MTNQHQLHVFSCPKIEEVNILVLTLYFIFFFEKKPFLKLIIQNMTWKGR